MIKIIRGNIFDSKCQTLVNAVNCQGVMGKGIALEFSYRFPEMVTKYKKMCEEKKINIGRLWIYKTKDVWVLNFPTKTDWKRPSKIEFIEKGLKNFVLNYKKEGVQSIAFPQLGSGNGGLVWGKVRRLMEEYLTDLEIPVEIYIYDLNTRDVLYDDFLNKVKDFSVDDFMIQCRLKQKQARLLYDVVHKKELLSFVGLRKVKGLGKVTISRLFTFLVSDNKNWGRMST